VLYRSVCSTSRKAFRPGGAGDPSGNPLLSGMRARAALYLPLARSLDRHLAARGWGAQLPLLAALEGLGGDGDEDGGVDVAAEAAVPA
jgi:hypothetical protein